MRYSYSNLAQWLKCPRQWEAKYVTRTWPDEPPSPALIRGQEVHEALERSVRDGAAPPPSAWLPPGLLDALRRAKAQAEVKIELAKPAFVGYLDVLMLGARKALVIDWKTGKLRPDPLQADVYAMLVRREYGIENITFAWVGVDSHKAVECVPDHNAERRVQAVIDDIETARGYPPAESWLCRYCPLTWCEKNSN